MLSMRERAELLGGFFSVTSEPGQGTVVQVSLPFSPDPDQKMRNDDEN
jgi:signal transduction histidine kinase